MGSQASVGVSIALSAATDTELQQVARGLSATERIKLAEALRNAGSSVMASKSPEVALVDAFAGEAVPPMALCTEIYGRICFRYPSGQPLPFLGDGVTAAGTHMDEPPQKPVCFVTDGIFLRGIAEQHQEESFGAREVLQRLGIEDWLIDSNIDLKARFCLCVFSAKDLPAGRSVVSADWAGVQKVAGEVWSSEVVHKLRRHWRSLETMSWTDLDGPSFAKLRGKHGPLTPAQYALAETGSDNAPTARRLLCDSLNLMEWYAGTGYTVDPRTGEQRAREYFAPNLALARLPAGQQLLLDL
mmetsp:Transcript_82636/g.229278  ORF Transcript_82636/g.229278 Transcript_82636/m.229278 type:complete len:300 (-) Transcript_82636:15-914(-)